MSTKILSAVFCLVASLEVAAAAPIQYTFSFLGAGTLNGNNFTARTVTLGFSSDTSLINQPFSGLFLTPNGIPATYDLAGFSSGTITDSVEVFDNQNASDAGFYLTGAMMDFFDIPNAAYATYDLKSPIGPINTLAPSFLDSAGVGTNNGQLVITSARNVTLTANTTGVPEPASYWLLAVHSLRWGWFVSASRPFEPRWTRCHTGPSWPVSLFLRLLPSPFPSPPPTGNRSSTAKT